MADVVDQVTQDIQAAIDLDAGLNAAAYAEGQDLPSTAPGAVVFVSMLRAGQSPDDPLGLGVEIYGQKAWQITVECTVYATEVSDRRKLSALCRATDIDGPDRIQAQQTTYTTSDDRGEPRRYVSQTLIDLTYFSNDDPAA